MIDTIYLERAAALHERSRVIIERYPKARVIECENYQAIFNRKQQNFRAQKSRPALILAHKQAPFIHSVPGDQHIGGEHNYYFSHLLNCPFDCRYCFLQGMFSSANYVLFVNYEDFAQEIIAACARHDGSVHLFSGYDCDSLALEPLTGFADFFAEQLSDVPNALLELRTKSTQIRSLLRRPSQPQCLVAMSLSPQNVVDAFEHGTPSLNERLNALQRLQQNDWPIGLRFDPVIPYHGAESAYRELVATVLDQLDAERIHSVTVGPMRLPKSFARRMDKLYPEEALFALSHDDCEGTLVTQGAQALVEAISADLAARVAAEKIFAQFPHWQD